MYLKPFLIPKINCTKKNPPPPPAAPNPKVKAAMDKLVVERDEAIKKILTVDQYKKYTEVAKNLHPPKPPGKKRTTTTANALISWAINCNYFNSVNNSAWPLLFIFKYECVLCKFYNFYHYFLLIYWLGKQHIIFHLVSSYFFIAGVM